MKAKETPLIELQFDQFSRQNMVFQLVKSSTKKKKLNILDIGGHLGKTEDFFSTDNVTITDLYDVKKSNYVKASALDLPFSDGEFDVVVSFDVFEHIPKNDRLKFLKEASRVSSDIIAIAAPFDTELVAEVEKEVNSSFKKLYGKNHPWLEEHIENGLPDLEATKKFFEKNNFAYNVYASNNLFLWKMMMNFYFTTGGSRLAKLGTKMNIFYNEHVKSLGDHTEPSYRKIVFVRKNVRIANELPVFESVIDNQVYNQFLEKMFKNFIEVLTDKQSSIEQAGALREHEIVNKASQEVNGLKNELKEIKSSKAWRLASGLRRVKKTIKG